MKNPTDMTKVIAEANERIIRFCAKNEISLNNEILTVPVWEIKAFFENRDQSGFNYCEEEARSDMGDSEAFFLEIDDLTGKPAIIYDEARMEKLDFEEKVQIIIHERLHFNGEDEADVETISILIASYPDSIIEDALEELSQRVNPEVLIEAYEGDLGKQILRRIYRIEKEEIREYLE